MVRHQTGSFVAGGWLALMHLSVLFLLLPGIAAAVPPLAGDADCNGVVEDADAAALTVAIFVGSDCAAADVNRDGQISVPDLTSLVAILATLSPPTATPTASGAPGTATMTPPGATSTTTSVAGTSTPTPGGATATPTGTSPSGATFTPTMTIVPPSTPTTTLTVPGATVTSTPSRTAALTSTPSRTATESSTPTHTPSPTASRTPTHTGTPTASRTPTQTGTFTQTPTLTAAPPSSTPAALGAEITFLAPIGSNGCEFCCEFFCQKTPTPTPAFDSQGRRIYERSAGRFLLVVEARPGASGRPPGVFLETGPGQPPDLQALASNDLGNGSAEVCDVSSGGVSGVDPPDLDRNDVTDAMRDMACRFSVQPVSAPCTRNRFGDFAFLGSGTTRQYCFQVPQVAAFPAAADTVLAVRVSDQVGNPGQSQEIVVRVD